MAAGMRSAGMDQAVQSAPKTAWRKGSGEMVGAYQEPDCRKARAAGGGHFNR